jgi:hypothetical protein
MKIRIVPNPNSESLRELATLKVFGATKNWVAFLVTGSELATLKVFGATKTQTREDWKHGMGIGRKFQLISGCFTLFQLISGFPGKRGPLCRVRQADWMGRRVDA